MNRNFLNPEYVTLSNFINGEFVAPKSGRYLDNYDPSTGKVYGKLPDSDALDVVMAVQAANKAFAQWSGETTTKKRAEFLIKIADVLEARSEEFAIAESKDVGKPIWLARETDLPRAIYCYRYFAALVLGETSQATEIENKAIEYTVRQPHGVTALIAPWNMPLYTLSFKIAPSLAVGNTVVCKPSEMTPMTAHMLAQIMSQVGLPPGVCNIIFGKGESVGSALVQHPGVPMISFTGGTETAEKIQQVAAPMFKRTSLELGGKNANIIFKDADIEKAVASSIRASFLNSGQICLSGSRLLIQNDIMNEFMAEFRKQTAELKVGDPSLSETFMGPLVSHVQREKVLAAIDQARKEDGRVTFGGDVPTHLPEKLQNGYFLRPTIIEDLTNCSDLWLREIFGPVVMVMGFKYAHDAVKWANTSPYGLSASIWTNDITRAHKMAKQIQAGTIWVNTWGLRDVRVPFGGFKASGIGREGGRESLRTYTETKTVCVAVG